MRSVAATESPPVQGIDPTELLDALKRFRRGDFTARLPVTGQGAPKEIAETFNEIVELNALMSQELARVGSVVGKKGDITARAEIGDASGAWAESIDSVNTLIGDMVQPVTEVARVIGAVAQGDLSQSMVIDVDGRPLRGEFRRIGRVVNTMVHQLSSFASEVSRVAREVGTEGKLGGQAKVKGVAGTWKDLTDNVNSMAANLTGQVRNIAEVTTAVANGDLSKKITVDVKGEIQELKDTINTMVDQLNSFASEVSRVAREVGTEGKLGGQAEVKGVGGTWKDLTDNVNSMAANLTGQVRNIAEVTTAVANGDLSKKITVDVKGEILELKETINIMVDQLNSFASEVTRVAREVGTEGKLGGQAEVKGVGGTWKDLTDNVNSMAANLTGQVRNIAEVTTAVANGDLSKKITVDVKGEILELKETINIMVDQLNSFASEVSRVAREVGTEGKLGGQADVKGVGGTWKDLTDNVNSMGANLTGQVRNIAEVTTAVANGDLSKKITVNAQGEILELKETINIMVDQLNSFASEVSRVAREVGTEGKLGGQAEVKGVGGTWKDLTDNVNSMAANLTGQVRNIAEVTTAVANGDLSKKITVDVKGEILELKDTINTMVDQLNAFASEVTRVAREVGTEGKLGGQAKVPGADGMWRDLTDNVNQLADNLTTQVRAIAEVATAVTKGDLTRSITVAASGEVAILKDHINEMIRNLKDTTLKNKEQDWLKTNIAKLTKMLQGQRDLLTVARLILSEVAPLVEAQLGVFYVARGTKAEQGGVLELLASYAFGADADFRPSFAIGQGLVGQCAHEGKPFLVTDIPAGYLKISSALGEAEPVNIIVLPVIFEGEVKAVIELASFNRFGETHQLFLDQLMESIGIVLNTIEANMRTEDLLTQAQSLTGELQSQQEELRKTNDRLEHQAENLRRSEELLKAQQEELQKTNGELEEKARLLSEQKAQLSAASRYKSQFLANMSHELRTPLNSLLILAKLLSDNADRNLSPKQVEFSKTIHAAGSDLLSLINDIFDLSKIESGTVTLDIGRERVADMRDYVDRTFRQVATDKDLDFPIEMDPALPDSIDTDAKRLRQIFKNLLSNAFKFTESGQVGFSMRKATGGWDPRHESLSSAPTVIAFAVTDTGIGIPPDKQKIIFEAFQQADGTTSRKYGGTGLGLSISREIARRLGGEIVVASTPGLGSTFTLYLPVRERAHRSQSTDMAALPPAVPPLVEADSEAADAAEAYDSLLQQNEVGDDRDLIQEGDRVLLIVEPDPPTATALLGLAHETGFKGIIALRGDAALALARKILPDAILLDTDLPDMDGWGVLDLLKHAPETSHIPVQVTTRSAPTHRGLRRGALACVTRPAQVNDCRPLLERMMDFVRRSRRSLLWVGVCNGELARIAKLLDSPELDIAEAGTAAEARAALADGPFDCIVIDLSLPAGAAMGLIGEIRSNNEAGADVPIIAYCTDPPDAATRSELNRLVDVSVYEDLHTVGRLTNEIAVLLHCKRAELSPECSELLADTRLDTELVGKTILVVDDDIRNIFSLTSVLEEYGIHVLYAESGREGIGVLERVKELDLVIMDVMMPDLDGYDTTRMIRSMPRFASLPILALTAKAMKGDREKCLAAGASDYMAKPIDIMQLLSMLRIWLKKSS